MSIELKPLDFILSLTGSHLIYIKLREFKFKCHYPPLMMSLCSMLELQNYWICFHWICFHCFHFGTYGHNDYIFKFYHLILSYYTAQLKKKAGTAWCQDCIRLWFGSKVNIATAGFVFELPCSISNKIYFGVRGFFLAYTGC